MEDMINPEDILVLFYRPEMRMTTNRKSLKSYLGGTEAFNKALERGDIGIIPCYGSKPF